MTQVQVLKNRQKRKFRVRSKLRGNSDRPRLHVYRSNKHIYAQVIDDAQGKTLAAASDKELKGSKLTKMDKAEGVGKLLADKAKKVKIKKVCFDRGSYMYQGRVKKLAESARQNGLEF